MGGNFMSKNNAKKNNNYYFPLFMGMGLVFGVILDQIHLKQMTELFFLEIV